MQRFNLVFGDFLCCPRPLENQSRLDASMHACPTSILRMVAVIFSRGFGIGIIAWNLPQSCPAQAHFWCARPANTGLFACIWKIIVQMGMNQGVISLKLLYDNYYIIY